MPDDLHDAIQDNAEGPAAVTSDGVTVNQHRLTEQIAADKHLKSQTAAANPAQSLRRMKLYMGGTV